MKQGWKYLLYASIVIVGGFIFFETIRLKNTGFEGKTLWDWMELLIIPAVLAGGAFFLNRSERKTEREIATDRQQEAALQTYLDRMADLLLKDKLRTSKDREVRKVARIRTLTVLRGLDGRRKDLVLQFLQEADLINKEKTIINLGRADLNGALVFIGKLRNTNLSEAFLVEAVMNYADLSGANLAVADLHNANLQHANLADAAFYGANLIGANLSNARLKGAIFDNALLDSANLKFAQDWTVEQLSKAKSLKGATMPDGTIHE